MRKNSFNVFRGVVHAVGGDKAPLVLAARIGALEKEHEERLCVLPDAQAAAFRSSRHEAMATPGSEKWVFPPVVAAADEPARREAWARGRGEEGEGHDVDDSEVESDGEGVSRPVEGAAAKKRRRPGVE